jgi:alpha-L-rhamnosidase
MATPTFSRHNLIRLFMLAAFLCGGPVSAQISPDLLTRPWTAHWITSPDAPERDLFVLHFRKIVELQQVPTHFIVHVSADNQFLLHVNQQPAGRGPARGDLAHWRYETYDLAPLLRSGRNVLAATVWGFGTRSAVAQISDRAGFLLQGDTSLEQAVDTNETWEAEQEHGIQLFSGSLDLPHHFYFAAEPSQQIDAAKFDWSWDADPANASSPWQKAVPLGRAAPRGSRLDDTNWRLVPDSLPPMAMELVPSGKVVRAAGIPVPFGFPDKPFAVPPHTKASVLLDASHLSTAFPEVSVSGGAGGAILLTYAEALYDEKGNKGNRNEIAGKHIGGVRDEFLLDGASKRIFMPLAWRTWRYLQLDITTADQPLQIERLRTWFSAYPFEQRAHFHSDDPSLTPVWDIGWRTARLDAHDTYMDTPYWERLQYVGDTRIQALISYTVAGDDRLARQAIQAFNDSRIPDGITQSRYPSSAAQFIPTFSLLWVGMVHDFWLYRDDSAFVRAQLPGTRTVLDWFLGHQRPDGLLDKLPWWVFVDWAEDFEDGEPPQDADGGSTPITLQFIEALRYAAEMEDAVGGHEQAQIYRAASTRAAEALKKLCWNQKFRLLADTPAQKHFSQHANILAVWLEVIAPAEQKAVLSNLLSTSDSGFQADGPTPPLSKATYYFRFYLARALDHAGMGDEYIRLLQPWRDMINLGLTTWAEQPDPTRSDSHAWSAHPNFDLLSIVAGIRPKAPRFAAVSIEPHLGALKHVSATLPHPKGEITVEYTRAAQNIESQITLPRSVSGELSWSGTKYPLHEGSQRVLLSLPPADKR